MPAAAAGELRCVARAEEPRGANDARRDAIAGNEVVFRDVNERIADLGSADGLDAVRVLCECGDRDCVRELVLARSEYETLRADPVLFAVAPGHVAPDVEVPVAENDRFWTVRKRPGEQEQARASDPRT